MTRLCFPCFAWLALVAGARAAGPPPSPVLGVSGTRFLLDGRPFPYTGVSFFNAIYNRAFNEKPAARREWLEKFKRHGVNVLRVWAQWDSERGFVDAAPGHTLYTEDGTLRADHLRTLRGILDDCAALGFAVELCLFSHESDERGESMTREARLVAAGSAASALKRHRNLALQIWNEKSRNTIELARAIKAADPERLVTSSPGVAGRLGSDDENAALDYLTPHTTRHGAEPHWIAAPEEIRALIRKFRKPVVDDEPARNGTPKFGGPDGATTPSDHILHIWNVWQVGGYSIYHHDMFQNGPGDPATPPTGIPEPGFSPYHRVVFEFLSGRERYAPWMEREP